MRPNLQKGSIQASEFLTFRLCNSACVWPTNLKFSSWTVLSLLSYDCKFQLNTSLISGDMPFQSHKIGWVYKTLFIKSVTYSVYFCGWMVVFHGQGLLHKLFHWKSFVVLIDLQKSWKTKCTNYCKSNNAF